MSAQHMLARRSHCAVIKTSATSWQRLSQALGPQTANKQPQAR